MSTDTIIADNMADNEAELQDLKAKYATSIAQFESMSTDPGSGFDLDEWLNIFVTPTPQEYTTDLASIYPDTLTATAPAITKPTLVTPEDMLQLVTIGGYDSAYLEELEQTIRTITANVIDEVIPVATFDAYYKKDRATKARTTVDDVADILSAHAGRGFPIIPMSAARQVTSRIEKWQTEEYSHQDNTSIDRLDAARKIHFASISNGIDIEQLRSKLIMEYSKAYMDHNRTLVAYYKQIMAERLAEARLVIDNLRADGVRIDGNFRALDLNNSMEISRANDILARALKQLANQFTADEETIKRRSEAMLNICSTYSGWVVGVLGQTQAVNVARHNVED